MNTLNSAADTAIPLIERRLEMRVPFSEDNFRYLVFHGLFKSGTDVARMVLEYPHPNPQLQGKKIDTVILDENGTPQVAIEFKYHRRNPNPKSDTNHSDKAGGLLKDFARLRDFPNAQRLVVYLTDDEMLKYFKNPEKDIEWLLDPRNEQEISDAKIPNIDTLQAKAGDWTRPALSQMLRNWAVGSDHRLIVWQVKPKG